LTDRLVSRVTYTVSLLMWSLATAAQGFCRGMAGLLAARFVIGGAETPAFPASTRSVAMWFPNRERGTAVSVFVMGQYIGSAMFAGGLVWMASTFGWQMVFFVTGIIGIVFAVIWHSFYRDPVQSKANAAELAYIESGGGLNKAREKAPLEWWAFWQILKTRQIIAICLGKFFNNVSMSFFLTWFPTYLVEQRHMTIMKMGIFQAMPFIGASVGILAAGAFADWMIRAGYTVSVARKVPLVVGCGLGMTIVVANWAASDVVVIAALTGAFFAQGIASQSWTALAECAPEGSIALSASITSFAANLSPVVAPVIIGYIVQSTGSFEWAIYFVGFMALCGTLSYSLGLGKLQRIVLTPARAAG
jgi:ACS family D-galactonate transporter-like MFS transporter